MTNCALAHAQLPAYLDGELIEEERTAFETHLASCASCRAWLEYERALGAAVGEALPRPEPPPELRSRIARLVEPTSTRSRRAWLATAAVAAAAILIALISPSTTSERGAHSPAQGSSPFVAAAVDSHLRYASRRLPLEVTSTRPEEVSRFFSGRVPFNVTLPDYPVGPGEQKFYELVGGRLVSLEGDYAAYIAYRMDGRPISLLVASAEKVRPWGQETVLSGALAFHLAAVSGLKVITWSDNGLTYALVSDLAVSGARSCLVCHGAPEERPKIEGLGAGI